MFDLAAAVLTLALACWLGAIVMQSFVVAPVVFKVLDEKAAGLTLRGLFPRFFRLGLACGIVSLGAAVALVNAGNDGGVPALTPVLILLMVSTQALALWLVPRINQARDRGAEGAKRFRTLHGVSVALTVGAMLGCGFLLSMIGVAAV